MQKGNAVSAYHEGIDARKKGIGKHETLPADTVTVPEGMALVPIRPTKEMKNAGFDALGWNESGKDDGVNVADIFHAMLSTAPEYPKADTVTLGREEYEALKKNAERYRWLRDKSEYGDDFYLSIPFESPRDTFKPHEVDEAIDHAMEYIAKGDPRDVAAYCAFLWRHGESTAPPPPANTVTPVGYISHDAYRGAMERAYAAERELHEAKRINDNLTRALAQEVNGQTFMGEPVISDTVTLGREELLTALEDLSFECFGAIGTCAPSLATYNRTFQVLQKYRTGKDE